MWFKTSNPGWTSEASIDVLHSGWLHNNQDFYFPWDLVHWIFDHERYLPNTFQHEVELVEGTIEDGSGLLAVTFYHRTAWGTPQRQCSLALLFIGYLATIVTILSSLHNLLFMLKLLVAKQQTTTTMYSLALYRSVHVWTISELHRPKKKGLDVYAKSPTAQEMLWQVPGNTMPHQLHREVGTAISCTKCSQLTGFIQKLIGSPMKIPFLCVLLSFPCHPSITQTPLVVL